MIKEILGMTVGQLNANPLGDALPVGALLSIFREAR